MSGLEQALTDYLRLRRSLGHELAEPGWLLPGFVAHLDACGSRTVTIEAALAWAQQANTGGPSVSADPELLALAAARQDTAWSAARS